MRSRDQFIADCEKRFAEIAKEKVRRDNDPKIQRPCRTCRWGDPFRGAWCHEPLVKGFGRKVFVGQNHEYQHKNVPLCGPEKALWQPQPPKPPTKWQQFKQFIDSIFE